MKKCPGCNQNLCETEFWRHRSRYDGLQPYCKSCAKSRYSEIKRTSMLVAYYRDKRKVLNKNLVWARNNPDKRKAQNKRWQDKHPEYATVKNHQRKSRLLAAEGSFTGQEFVGLCQKYGNVCLKCGRPASEVLITPDHVVPLSLGGRNSIENIQPLCVSCNKSKYTRVADYRECKNGST